jgi:O-6-methylguanine DNA methyltransferase
MRERGLPLKVIEHSERNSCKPSQLLREGKVSCPQKSIERRVACKTCTNVYIMLDLSKNKFSKESTMVVAAPKTTELYWSSVSCSQGLIIVMATELGVCWTGTPGTPINEGFSWLRRKIEFDRAIEGEEIAPLQQAMNELRRYLAGERVQFTCPLDLHGTAFQKYVWEELYRIPYGETRTYAGIALAIGRPNAVRAVGAANGANPVAIIVPCHRVIGSNGTLTGYGGGLPTKAWLLALEGIKNKTW